VRSTGLEVVGVVEGSRPGEKDSRAGRVEGRVGDWEGGDVKRLKMGIRKAIDL
jgi:hypothetical protein